MENNNENKKNTNLNSIKNVMIVFLFLLVGLMSYIAYFQVFKAPEIAEKSGNRRIWAERNEVLRGTIYDRDRVALTTSERETALNQKRGYVYGDLYAHPLGYADKIYNLSGLEKEFDKELTSYNSISNGLRSFFKEFDIDGLKQAFNSRDDEKNKIGNSIVTTLDTDIQKAAFDALGNNKGAVVALDPRTGEVLALVSKPSFNPNDLESSMKAANEAGPENTPLINRTINGLYPPGSTFKTITSVSALDNISDANTRVFKDDGKITFPDGSTLKNDSNSVYGNINLKKAYIVSSNDVFGELAIELGNSKLKASAEKFGFNNDLSTQGLSISTSRFPELKDYEVGEIARTGIGQSKILATPMQMALVASAVANDGVIMQPKIVNEVIDKDGHTVKKYGSKKYGDAMSTEDARIIKDYMKSLVDGQLGGKWSYFRGTDTAGKTGTADYLLPNGQQAKPHSWFIGFAPANNPKVAVAVIVENGGYGSGLAASVAGKTINAALKN